jgi:Nuclease-related domain
MQIITNDKLVRRNRAIARYASIVGLIVLIGGMIVSFSRPELVIISFAALIMGFLLSQVGMYFTNRWGREPRPDQFLNQGLKGLDNKYTLYHYTTPVPHLLVGPAGIWVLMPKHQKGAITYEKGRWRQKGGGFLQSYLRLFAQEGIGRPDLEVAGEVDSLETYLKKNLPEVESFPIQAALVFTNEKADLQIDESVEVPIPTLYLNKLKELIRKSAKAKPITAERLGQIQALLSPTEEGTTQEEESE